MQDTIPKFAYDAFDVANHFVADDPVVLDSGCGTGESSYRLAQLYPDKKIIGIDKSSARLQRSHAHGEQPKNLLLVQANCIYMWRLIRQAQWDIHHHYLLYPNPWPKPAHVQKRWHGHPIFPTLISLGGKLVLRTNWEIYALEFAQAITLLISYDVTVAKLSVVNAFTPFERKYIKSHHSLYEIVAELSESKSASF
jgi:tRNA G46 methylase TrmB